MITPLSKTGAEQIRNMYYLLSRRDWKCQCMYPWGEWGCVNIWIVFATFSQICFSPFGIFIFEQTFTKQQTAWKSLQSQKISYNDLTWELTPLHWKLSMFWMQTMQKWNSFAIWDKCQYSWEFWNWIYASTCPKNMGFYWSDCLYDCPTTILHLLTLFFTTKIRKNIVSILYL